MSVDFTTIRRRLDLADVAAGESLRAWRRGARVILECPACHKGATTIKDDSGARARDGVTWGCVRCGEGGDVIDLLRLARGLDATGAIKLACQLAGLDQGRASDAWRPTPRPSPPPAPVPDPLAEDDLAERMRAVQAAADHYRLWAGEWRQAESRFYELLEAGAWQRKPLDATEADNPCLVSWRMVVRWERDRREPALGYIAERMGAMHEAARPILRELVGLCPSRQSGLRAHLIAVGGPALVAAAARVGLFLRNGAERFAGRLVYVWTDADGRAVYLTGRAVPALVEACGTRDDRGEIVKGMALPVFNPAHRDDRLGVPAPSAPFGAHLALVREGPVVIVEGELDAIHQLVAGPAVATGGTGRMGNARGFEALRRVLAGREAVVAFDLEADPDKQRITDKRAADLAHAIGAAWVPGGRAA